METTGCTARSWRHLTALLACAVALLGGGCGPDQPSLSHLDAQGEAGRLAREVMEAHGGIAAFLALTDLEYTVVVEEFDASGIFQAASRELHRFATAPPRRYLLRRSAARVAEFGLMGDVAWSRLDGRLLDHPEVIEHSRRELAVLSLLNRSPFCLADPGLSLQVPDRLPAAGGRLALRQIAVERVSEEPGRPERYVFLFDADTGLLHEVLFESDAAGDGPPLRVARAEELHTLGGVRLVSRWSLAPADRTGRAVELYDTVWAVEDAHADNGFTDNLYRPSRLPGS